MGRDFLAALPALLDEAGWPADARADATEGLRSLLAEGIDPAALAEAAPGILDAASASADPPAALRHFARWLRAAFQPTGRLRLLAANPEPRALLLGLFAYSPFLADACVRNPEYVDWLFSEASLDREKPMEAYERELAGLLRTARSRDARRRALCRYRRRELIRLGARDMLGFAGVPEQCREVSRLAEASIRAAFADSWAAMAERHGLPAGVEAPDPESSSFAVIALGKLGGGELNYSSDVDLLFAYECEGTTTGALDAHGDRVRRLAHNDFFGRVAADLSKALSEPTDEGIAWRVDARLRPDGSAGPMARSLDAFAAYFADHARAWERIAYQKARFVAGDPRVGAAFEKIAEAYAYGDIEPRTLLSEIARLKARIDNDRLDERERRLDIKRGPGGIREIEFLAGVQQILLGGANPALRIRSTVSAMDALVEHGAMEPEVRDLLREAYFLFRRIEHSVQLVADRQTQRLPHGAEERALLGRRLGYPDAAAFESLLDRHRSEVRGRFQSVFHTGPSPGPRLLQDELLQGGDPSPEALKTLEGYGLPARESFSALRELAAGTSQMAIPKRAQRLFERVLPRLLEELESAALPAAAIRQMSNFLQVHRAVATLYEMLLEHPPLVRLLARVCGYGSLPARLMTAKPEWFDALLEGEALSPDWRPPEADPERWRGIAERRGADAALAAVRGAKQQAAFFLCVREILGIDDADAPGRWTARLADACFAGAAGILAAERPCPADRWAVIALGSYGADEVHLCGDLDIAFLCDGVRDSAGANDFAARLVSTLSAMAPEGRLWPTDARLRPEGANSPLAVPLDRFRRYYESEAGTWEFQSLTRGRFALGNESLAREAFAAASAAWEARRPDDAALSVEIWSMRQRMEATAKLPRFAEMDLKGGPGGLVDIEFLAQRRSLAAPGGGIDGVGHSPTGILRGTGGEGDAFLAAHFDRVRRVQRAVRLLFETSRSHLPKDAAKKEALRRALEASGEGFVDAADFRRARELVRAELDPG